MTAGQQAAAPAGPAPVKKARPGTPLAGAVRERMEGIVGGDLSGVALHTDALAADRARRAGTLALTEGADVDFAAGAYRPGTVTGEALLAHELAHVRQQHGGPAARATGTAPGLETEADRAGLAAVLRFYEPRSRQAAATPRITGGHGLRLQRCTAPEFPEIGDLPTRAEYEERGELDELVPGELVPIATELGVEVGKGGKSGDAAPTTAEPLPEIDPSAPELDAEQLLARLAVMEDRQGRIDALAADLDRGLVLQPASTYLSIRHDIAEPKAPGELVLSVPPNIPGLEPVAFGPWTAATLSRALPRSEEAQRRAEAALVDLAAVRANESAAHGPLVGAGYDLEAACAAIDGVRLAYATASAVVLGPQEVTKLAAADEARRSLDTTLVRLLIEYHEQRSAPGEEIAGSVSAMQTWAGALGAELARLNAEADAIRAARERGEPDVGARAKAFARGAQVVATSLDALAEWDVALTAYELLRDNTALWGEDAVYRIAGRLDQMKEASLAGDEAYLRLMLRDHRADPDVQAFYADLPEIIEKSHMIIGFALLLITAAVTAGVGVVITGAAAGVAASVEASALAAGASASAAAAEASIVLQMGLVAKIGGEALVFTIVHRQLSSAIPGMEPKSSFLYDLVWNLALFGAMAGTGALVEGALARSPAVKALVPAVKTVVTVGAKQAGAYATLQAYGMVRFLCEEQRMMSPSEFAKMSADNLVMLAGLSIAMTPISSALKPLEAGSFRAGARASAELIRFRGTWAGEFRGIDAQRAELQQDLARLVDDPQATEEEAAGIRTRAADLDQQLRVVIDQAVSATDIEGLREGLVDVTAVIQATPVPELFGRMGLDPVVDLRATGDPATWTYAPGRAGLIDSFLADAELPASADSVAGQRLYEVAVAGQGPVTLVERTGEVAAPAAAPAAGEAPSVLDPLAAKGGYVAGGVEAVKAQTIVPGLAARLEALVNEGKASQAQRWLEIAGRLAKERAKTAAARPGTPPTPEQAAEAAQEGFNAERSHMLALDLALSDAKAARGLTRLAGKSGPGLDRALAAAAPENVEAFLQAMDGDLMGGSGPDFYQSLARSRPACDLINGYGGRVFWRIVNLHDVSVSESLRLARARLDIERTLGGLNEGRITAADLLRRITSGSRISVLDKLVGPRPKAGPAFDPVLDDPEWPNYVTRAKKYAADHPVEGGEVTAAEIQTRATLLQTVTRARAREFSDYTPAERTKALEEFNALAYGARLDRGWVSATRGYLNEALALGAGRASVGTKWWNGRVVTKGPKGALTIPDEADPPVRASDLEIDPLTGLRKVETTPRRWLERKSYELGGDVDGAGVSKAGKAAATQHATDAAADLTNLPPGSTIEVQYASDPGPVTRQAMLRSLFAEPGVERVMFEGTTYTRADLAP